MAWRNVVEEKGSKAAFAFTHQLHDLYFYSPHDGFSIRLTLNMARFLGYEWRIFLNTLQGNTVKSRMDHTVKLKPDDFKIMVYNVMLVSYSKTRANPS